ncbi:MAG: FMN-binding negative transcriptional regulator [Gammaproteobacteria bacterium]|nr:FMN-binding negative transcriptional regulator [Gammaproteobacteria bacterium]MBU6510618.1 FMN-binding negative transcriptional regulator [Gammaproteobacteria bacterium]MDE2109271.1 FMN-binding negative transcriptional regulator [Gammaproteobacteria bacterium]
MYTPAAFQLDDVPRLHALIRKYPFAPLLTAHPGGIAATHLPFMVDETRGRYGTLIAHMARANDHWQLFDGRRKALTIFTGAHAYISPSWYQSPVTVPTWNYVVVHAHGRPVIVSDKLRVRAILEQLVATYEAYVHPPWSTALAGDYIDDQIQYIVAFEIEIERLEGKFKFNQNRSRADQEGVVRALSQADDPLQREVAVIMAENLKL